MTQTPSPNGGAAGSLRIAGLILAGGEGRRLGGVDKALVLLNGRSLLSHVAERFEPQVEAVALSANGDPGRFASALAGRGWPVLPDADEERLGPMAGLLAGLDWAAGWGASHLASVSVDTPFLPGDLVVRLLLGCAAPGGSAIAQSAGGRHPTCGLWPVGLRSTLAAAIGSGERRLGRWASDQGAVGVAFADTPDPFFNINRPEDLAQAERWLIAG